ncbi:MAG TPA: hypothetical protein VHC49_00725 [Mycobacteriales bacterium]|nr:hypothetical protein [Mycobacteriales bacterium]
MPAGDPYRIRNAAQSLRAIAFDLHQHGAVIAATHRLGAAPAATAEASGDRLEKAAAVLSRYAAALQSAQRRVRALNDGTATEPRNAAIIAALDRRARCYARELSTGPAPGSAGSNRR